MNYIDFKKILNKSNIYLYDADTRIIHWEFENLLKLNNNNNNNNNQTGGSINNYKIIIDKLKKKNLFNNLIYSINDDNTNRINYIMNLIK